MDQSSEVAQRLASNEKTIRDRALRKLRKYLLVRSTHPDKRFSNDELDKLWKGLQYTMWAQDKPLLQEELSRKLCGLLKCFEDGEAAMNFAAAFFRTQSREWDRLDQWRMDKYMMLVRDFLNATLEAIKTRSWSADLLQRLADIVQTEVMDATQEAYPDSLRIHFADIYLEEVAKVGADQVTGEQIVVLLTPFLDYIQKSNRDTVVDRVSHAVFDPIIEGDEETAGLKVDLELLKAALFERGQKATHQRNRKKLYHLIRRCS